MKKGVFWRKFISKQQIPMVHIEKTIGPEKAFFLP